MVSIAVITPVFNRVDLVERLYSSFLVGRNSNLVWYVIDDGSTDGTGDKVLSFQNQGRLKIVYRRQENSGKHAAVSLGFSIVEEDWLVVVDSDDWLFPDAYEQMVTAISELPSDVSSISFHRSYSDGRVVGDLYDLQVGRYVDRYNKGIDGDKPCLHRTSSCKLYSYPVFDGENFMAEMPFFIWFSQRYKTMFVNRSVVFCEYQEGGLTAGSVRNRYRCIRSTLFVYGSMMREDSGLKVSLRARAAINYWRFGLGSGLTSRINYRNVGFVIAGLCLKFNDGLKALAKKLKF
jgi:glycosyltransferase involved in cell wall biosynthesis